jgi:hypothetical protein
VWRCQELRAHAKARMPAFIALPRECLFRRQVCLKGLAKFFECLLLFAVVVGS